jgi:hypothetical protein
MKKMIITLALALFSSTLLYAQWSTNGTNIYYSSGNVGIRTTNPVAGLSTEAGTSAAIATLTDVPNGSAWIGAYGSNGGITIGQFGGNYGYIQSRHKLGGYSSFKLVINPLGGNVGIGITNPQNKLDVNGTVHAQSVKVDMDGWDDYVFKPDYKLPSLTEVKNYIDQNQHLPGIPSEQEIVKGGLNLGEINKLLMKKVEELTLYAIENEQKDKEKDKQLSSLQEQIDALTRQLKAITATAKR